MPRPSRLFFLAVAAAACALAPASCAQRPTQAPLRSLERSGRIAVACIGSPELLLDGTQGRPARSCGPGLAPGGSTDFALDPETGAEFPHSYALVTQQTRGELAVIDLSVDLSVTQSILDADLATPGLNFLPVGAQPTDVAVSLGGAGAYVASAEPNRPGLYALPANRLRGPLPELQPDGAPAATLRSWPACRLPSAPGRVLVVASDLPAGGPEARLCPGPNPVRDQPPYAQFDVYAGDATSLNVTYPNDALPDGAPRPSCRDAAVDGCKTALAAPDGRAEKLLVTLPETGELLVVDAQTLFDRPPGSFDPCPIEKAVKLRVDLPAAPPPEPDAGPTCPALPAAGEPAGACPGATTRAVAYPTAFAPRPAAVALERDGRRLYVADEGAPVVHVLSLEDGCALRELPPLLPGSVDEPGRPVFTSTLAVSPLTSDLRTYLYAVDREQGSLMAFDVSAGSARRAPLERGRADLQAFGARDRLRVGGAVRDVAFFARSVDADDASGALVNGACDPSGGADDPAGLRTAADFGSGAGPRPLRGVFALVTLTSGQVRVVDVDDLDAACRGYKTAPGVVGVEPGPTPLAASVTGCEACAVGAFADTLGASGELSCHVVERHELRSAYYFANKSSTGLHAPLPQSAPVLTANGASLRTDASEEARANPKLLGPAAPNPYYAPGPLPAPGEPGYDPSLHSPVLVNPDGSPTTSPPTPNPFFAGNPVLGDGTWAFERGGSLLVSDPSPARSSRNFVAPDLREPRAHVDQNWSVWYEAPLPGFDNRFGDARFGSSEPDAARRGLFDPDADFCDRGVQDRAAARLAGARLLGLRADATDPAEAAALDRFAAGHADYVQIADELLGFEDPYWSSTGGACDFYACEAAYGPASNPSPLRDFAVREAYQDRVLVEAPARSPDVDCCFPTLVRYRVRAQNTWAVLGSALGFQHRTVVDPATGRCVEQGVDQASGAFCDPRVELRTGRAYELLSSPPPVGAAGDGDGDGVDDAADACPGAAGVAHPDPGLNGCALPAFAPDPRFPCRDEAGRVAPDRRPGDATCYPPAVGDRATFRNGVLHLVVYRGTEPSRRDMVFSWAMGGGFAPLEVNLNRAGFVAPHSTLFVPGLQRLLVTDGGQNGVMSIDAGSFGVLSPITYL
jgi:hypothetical protein